MLWQDQIRKLSQHLAKSSADQQRMVNKIRKSGGGRKKLKPEYDAGKILKEKMERAVSLYDSDQSLQTIAGVLNLNPIKVRKLLITASVYESDLAEKVKNTFKEYRETQDYKTSILSIASALELSKSSVTSYLPYAKGVYFSSTAPPKKISVGAERQRRYRAVVDRPKALGDIRGVTYIYGMFYRFRLIDVPDEVKEKMKRQKRPGKHKK